MFRVIDDAELPFILMYDGERGHGLLIRAENLAPFVATGGRNMTLKRIRLRKLNLAEGSAVSTVLYSRCWHS